MGYTTHGILQGSMLEWVAFPFSKASSQPRGPTRSPTLQADSLPAESNIATIKLRKYSKIMTAVNAE